MSLRTANLAWLLASAVVLSSCRDGNAGLSPVPAASFTLAAEAPPGGVMQGGEGESRIAITRVGAPMGLIELSVMGAPAGVSVTIEPWQTAGSNATIIVRADPTAAVGPVTLTITGAAPGHADQTARTTFNVVAASSGTGNVLVDFSQCAPSEVPIWFAYQDGDGAWSQVLGVRGRFGFDVQAARGAYATILGDRGSVIVTYATQAELVSAPRVRCPSSLRPSKTVSGDIAGVNEDDVVYVRLGGGAADPEGGPVWGSFTLRGVADGPRDLVAYRSVPLGNSDRLIVRRDQDVANNGSLGVLDFEGNEAVAAATGRLTISGLTGPPGNHYMAYYGERECTQGWLYDQHDVADRFTMRGVPARLQRATDFHRITVHASDQQVYRSASESFHAMADRVIALPSDLPIPRITRVAGSHPRLSASLTLPPEYQQSLEWVVSEQQGGSIDMFASFAWLGGPNAELQMPDFGVVTGWKRAYLPFTEGQKSWYIFATGTNQEANVGPCRENARTVDAVRSGVF